MTDPALETLWKRVLDDWNDDAAHGAFMEHCRATSQLLEGAVRYRGMAGDHARGPVASKRLEAIAHLAVSELETERTPEPRGMQFVTQVVLIVIFVGATVALIAGLYP
jgi:hypothetical protein